ncbi:TatD family hydrolase [Luteimonas kalidii]|uniref:TatD family hydrolase n=1 Tax=Luteimonas kalidii TaxID=3042025 RepID=A0ABT6JTR3_9GAMM|nr:TatD family hydrolase [Luteimonas kalidii]MDH5833878.1 TatD family hydrolase [Luteimonas kalidii]
MELIDSHCHLDASEFDRDRDSVVARARTAGVCAQVLPAVEAAGWTRLGEICAATDGLHPAYGLHPMFLSAHRPAHLDALRDRLARERAVAVGECGLDYYVDGLDRDAQQVFFEGQLRLAREFDLPVIVHARRAVDAVIATLRRIGGLRGVVHSWSGSEEQAQQLWKMGFLLGIGGPVTYERARRLRRLVASMPLEHLLLETDAPDQPDAAIRGQRNEPARLANVFDAVVALRDEDPEAIAHATRRNAIRLFGLAHATPAASA